MTSVCIDNSWHVGRYRTNRERKTLRQIGRHRMKNVGASSGSADCAMCEGRVSAHQVGPLWPTFPSCGRVVSRRFYSLVATQPRPETSIGPSSRSNCKETTRVIVPQETRRRWQTRRAFLKKRHLGFICSNNDLNAFPYTGRLQGRWSVSRVL